MSETITDADLDAIATGKYAAPAPELEPEPPPPEPAATPEPDAKAPDPAPEADPEPEAPKPAEPPKWQQTRIDQLSREKGELARARDLALREAQEAREALAAALAGKPPDTTQLTAAQIRQEAERIAAETLAGREVVAKNERFITTGRAEFPEFDQRCNVVASIGALDKPEFMAVIREMDDGPKVVMHLADHADETARILALPPHAMALALAKISRTLEAPAPKAVAPSKVPKPIAPVGGVTQGSPDIFDEGLSMKDWNALMDKRDADRKRAARR
jgi:hypothetical protein